MICQKILLFSFGQNDDPGFGQSIFNFGTTDGSPANVIEFLNFPTGDTPGFYIWDNSTNSWANASGNAGDIEAGKWAYWSASAQDMGDGTTDIKIYKDGDLLDQQNYNFTLTPITRTNNYLGALFSDHIQTFDGDIADFTIFDKAMTDAEVEAWYEDVASVGLENSFFSMDSEALTDALDKIEAHFTGAQIGIEATRNQMTFKQSLHDDAITTLLSVDTEEVAVQANLAQTRQTLAITSLSISSQSHSNILNLFN